MRYRAQRADLRRMFLRLQPFEAAACLRRARPAMFETTDGIAYQQQLLLRTISA